MLGLERGNHRSINGAAAAAGLPMLIGGMQQDKAAEGRHLN